MDDNIRKHYKVLTLLIVQRFKAIVCHQSILLSQGILLNQAHLDYVSNVKDDNTAYIENIHSQVQKLGIDIMTNHYCSSFILLYSLFESLLFDLVFHHYLNSDHSKNDANYTVSVSALFANDISFHRKSWAESCARNVISLRTDELFRKIAKMFNLKLTDINSEKIHLAEIRARRNIALHRGWIADHGYCSNYGSDTVAVDTPLHVDRDYFNHSTAVIISIVDWLNIEFQKKL